MTLKDVYKELKDPKLKLPISLKFTSGYMGGKLGELVIGAPNLYVQIRDIGTSYSIIARGDPRVMQDCLDVGGFERFPSDNVAKCAVVGALRRAMNGGNDSVNIVGTNESEWGAVLETLVCTLTALNALD